MAGFETVVRPAVLPNIRPKAAQTLPPADDPESGFCVISGNPASEVTLTTSWSSSTSRSHQVETERRVDEVRVYQMDDDGTVNRDNFVDVDVANRIRMQREAKTVERGQDQKISEDNYYKRIQEEKNIEIRKRNQIQKNEEQAARDAGYDVP